MKMIQRVAMIMLVTAAAILSAGCSMPTVDAGKVGVIHEKPWFFGKGGITDDRVVLTGQRELFAFTTSIVEVYSTPQTISAHTDDVFSSNKVPLDFDVAITIAPTSDVCVAKMYKKFGRGPVGTFAQLVMPTLDLNSYKVANPSGEFMSNFRDAVRRHHMDEYIVGQTAEGEPSDAIPTLEKNLAKDMNTFLAGPTGGCLAVANVSIGRANPPDEMKGALARTAEQVQMVRTERERKLAQDGRKAAEEASALADKAQQIKLGFSNDEFIKIKTLETIVRVCGSASKELKDTTTGKSNCTFVIGNISGAAINVR